MRVETLVKQGKLYEAQMVEEWARGISHLLTTQIHEVPRRIGERLVGKSADGIRRELTAWSERFISELKTQMEKLK